MSREITSVSPELALVDPGLAEWARDRLPPPPDTLEALGVARPRPMSAPAAARRRPRRWRSRVLTAAGLLVVFAGTALLVGGQRDVDRPTAASLPPIAEPPPPAPSTGARPSGRVDEPAARTPSPGARTSKRVDKPAARTASPRRPSGAAAGTRRFAWPPVVGATGYHVELFKGSALIFRDETRKPQIVIRRRWRFNGRRHGLGPGRYRWYVWPLIKGQRRAKAIVQAQLVVSG